MYYKYELEIRDTDKHYVPKEGGDGTEEPSWLYSKVSSQIISVYNVLDETVKVSVRGSIEKEDVDMDEYKYIGPVTHDVSIPAGGVEFFRISGLEEWRRLDMEITAQAVPSTGELRIFVRRTL